MGHWEFIWQLLMRCVPLGLVCLWPATSQAWVFPEHRDIAATAVSGLDAVRKAQFERLWQQVRLGDEARLCEQAADLAQGVAPSCIDWAALSGIAGDHACSSAEMLDVVRSSDWILTVADIASQLKEDLARIAASAAPGPTVNLPKPLTGAHGRLLDNATRARWTNALRIADTRLQRADPKYATRADSNLAHFLLPRANTNLEPLEYAVQVLRPGAPLNAAGVYVWFHLSALQKADRLATAGMDPDERRRLARAALADEAFALHFLQDMFAAGHIAGSWGDVSQRKGTHDYYNENGLEAFTWKGRDNSIVLMGDAHMRLEDAVLAAKTVRKSLAEVIDAAAGAPRPYDLPHMTEVKAAADDFDICVNTSFPQRDDRFGAGLSRYRGALELVLLDTPIPGLGPGPGAQPRSRSELGTFVGLAGSIETRRVHGGFEASETDTGTSSGLEFGVRAGLGLEGALGDSGDGLAYVHLGYHLDGPSSNRIYPTAGADYAGDLGAAIPARSGVSLRLRAPYYLIPGDLLLLSPLLLIDRESFSSLAVTASNGGLLGLQQGYATRFGRFQFVLGREIGFTWYGLQGDQDLIAPPTPEAPNGMLVRFKSLYIDLPILEYRPFRSFSADQSSTLLFQLFAGIDRPFGVRVEEPVGAPAPELRSVKRFGIRMFFDWRHYF
jgi:hypothetical protein